jgi:hypothetical protein
MRRLIELLFSEPDVNSSANIEFINKHRRNMDIKHKTLTINGVEYIEKSAVEDKPELDKDYFMVRTQNAGVFYGQIEAKSSKEVTMRNARRVWYWSGAATLSQLAVDRTNKPKECKFPCKVDSITLYQPIEILSMTKKAKDSLDKVAVWEQ